MREKEVQTAKPTETREESAEQRESKKRDEKRRTFDTLTDDNPLICRGMD